MPDPQVMRVWQGWQGSEGGGAGAQSAQVDGQEVAAPLGCSKRVGVAPDSALGGSEECAGVCLSFSDQPDNGLFASPALLTSRDGTTDSELAIDGQPKITQKAPNRSWQVTCPLFCFFTWLVPCPFLLLLMLTAVVSGGLDTYFFAHGGHPLLRVDPCRRAPWTPNPFCFAHAITELEGCMCKRALHAGP